MKWIFICFEAKKQVLFACLASKRISGFYMRNKYKHSNMKRIRSIFALVRYKANKKMLRIWRTLVAGQEEFFWEFFRGWFRVVSIGRERRPARSPWNSWRNGSVRAIPGRPGIGKEEMAGDHENGLWWRKFSVFSPGHAPLFLTNQQLVLIFAYNEPKHSNLQSVIQYFEKSDRDGSINKVRFSFRKTVIHSIK